MDRGAAAAVPTSKCQGDCSKLQPVLWKQTRGICSCGPTPELPGGLLQLPWRRSAHPNCTHSVAPTAGPQGGPLWLRLSTWFHPKSSCFGGAIAAKPGGLRQLLQHTNSLAIADVGFFPMHGHSSSDQLAARLLAAPVDRPAQQLGGACREGACLDLLSGLVAQSPSCIKDLTCQVGPLAPSV